MDLAELTDRIVDRLAGYVRGDHAAQARAMEPDLAYGRHFHHPPADARPAAVMALLFERDGRVVMPLVVRGEAMTRHAGQIALPGGSVEPGETNHAAALRELEEELAVPQDAVRLLGHLPPLWVFVSNFTVTPWLAIAEAPPDLVPQPGEVAEVLEVPWSDLIRGDCRGQFRRAYGSLEFIAPCFRWQGRKIWGATAVILSEVMAAIGT